MKTCWGEKDGMSLWHACNRRHSISFSQLVYKRNSCAPWALVCGKRHTTDGWIATELRHNVLCLTDEIRSRSSWWAVPSTPKVCSRWCSKMLWSTPSTVLKLPSNWVGSEHVNRHDRRLVNSDIPLVVRHRFYIRSGGRHIVWTHSWMNRDVGRRGGPDNWRRHTLLQID